MIHMDFLIKHQVIFTVLGIEQSKTYGIISLVSTILGIVTSVMFVFFEMRREFSPDNAPLVIVPSFSLLWIIAVVFAILWYKKRKKSRPVGSSKS